MAKFNLEPNLDLSLKASIASPGGFMEDLDFVYSLLSYPVIAPKPLFSVEISDHSVLPVFTSEADWEVFVANLATDEEQIEWSTQAFPDLMNQVLQYKIDTIGFNLRTGDVTKAENLQYYDKEKLLEFIKAYNDVMVDLTSEENQQADKFHRLYLVPAFLEAKSEDEQVQVRTFLALKTAQGKQYLPIFDNLQSLVNWYFDPELTKDFKEKHGQICPIRPLEFIRPTTAENRLPATEGLLINPLDLNENEIEKSTISWDDLTAEFSK